MSNEPSTKSTGSADATAVELPFQAEVQQVLALVINSLYTHKEVFLRELISNASDALDKARFLALTQQGRDRAGGRAAHPIKLDEEARTLTIEDNGIGMTRDEVIQNLGTIARSGSLEFLKAHAEARRRARTAALKLIGQFGVGFYAAFMVAARVDVHTRSMLPGAGAGDLALDRLGRVHRRCPAIASTPGTAIVLHLKEDAREYAKAWRIKEIIHKYSDFVHVPDRRRTTRSPIDRPRSGRCRSRRSRTSSTPNSSGASPASTRRRPSCACTMSIDAPVQFHALLYVPEKAPLDLFQQGSQGSAPLRQARPHRGGLRQAHPARTFASCEAWSTRRTPAQRFTRDAAGGQDALQQIQQQLTKSVLKGLQGARRERGRQVRSASGREFGRVLKEGRRPSTGSTRTRIADSAVSSR